MAGEGVDGVAMGRYFSFLECAECVQEVAGPGRAACGRRRKPVELCRVLHAPLGHVEDQLREVGLQDFGRTERSEERRVGKKWRFWWRTGAREQARATTRGGLVI